MISVDQIYTIAHESSYKEGEINPKTNKPFDEASLIEVPGITAHFGFHKDRIEKYRSYVALMIDDLPHAFRTDTKNCGHGMTFLNMCVDSAGNQWGDHKDMEMLFVLASALGMAKFCTPRDMWDTLPGGMPYICFWLSTKENADVG